MHHSNASSSEHFVNPFGTLALHHIGTSNGVRALFIGLDIVGDMHGFSGRGVVDVVGQESREDKWIILKV